MRISRWLSGAGAVASFVSWVAIGCGSSAPTPANEIVADASADSTANPESASPSCYVDASLTVFAASDAGGARCAACVQALCSAAVTACATNCVCIDLFTCLADSGVATMGLGPAVLAAANMCAGSAGVTLLNNPGIAELVSCLSGTCAAACNADGGVDAGANAAANDTGASDGASDAGDGAAVADAMDGAEKG